MQQLDPSEQYDDSEVVDALTGRYGTRVLSYRYDRLDEHNDYLEPIDYVVDGKVANNALADIKRTATFALLDRGGINYLKDRIRPWARLRMPARDAVLDLPPELEPVTGSPGLYTLTDATLAPDANEGTYMIGTE